MRFRPKSLAIMNTTPTKLLSLREAQQYNFNKNESTILDNYKTLIDVGECASLPPTTYHTVINVSLPPKRASNKKSSSVSSWKSFFIKNSTSSPHRYDLTMKKADNRVVLLSRIGWLNLSD